SEDHYIKWLSVTLRYALPTLGNPVLYLNAPQLATPCARHTVTGPWHTATSTRPHAPSHRTITANHRAVVHPSPAPRHLVPGPLALGTATRGIGAWHPTPPPGLGPRAGTGRHGHAGAGTRHPAPGPWSTVTVSLHHDSVCHVPCPLCLLTSTAVRWTETSRSID